MTERMMNVSDALNQMQGELYVNELRAGTSPEDAKIYARWQVVVIGAMQELARMNDINRQLVEDWNRQLVRTSKLETELRQARCLHDYEVEDDKGWTCKKCGHGT